MILKSIFAGIEADIKFEFQSMDIKGIAYDSRKVEEGFIFVAIKGFTSDGHEFLEKAVALGATALVIEDTSMIPEAIKMRMDIAIIKVNDSRGILAILARNFYKNPSAAFKLIGITGTNGKTSITYILSDILQGLGEKTGIIGTMGNRVGDAFYKTNNTTPESLELNQLFKHMQEAEIDSCLMEVSSHSLALKRVSGLEFDVAIFTNLTEDHLDFHKDMEAYYKTKAKLFKKVSTGSAINIDDPYGERLYGELSSEGFNVMTYGLTKSADVYADNIVLHLDHSTFDLVTPDFKMHIALKLPGRIYIYNVLAAVTTLILLEYDVETIEAAIDNVKPIRGRMESVSNDLGINMIVDYAHTPDALKKLIETVKEFTTGKVVTLFGCGGDRDKMKRPIMGEIASTLSDEVIVTSDNPRSEDPLDIIEDIKKGLNEKTCLVHIESDRKEAILLGLSLVKKGDSLIIAGKGHETYQMIGTQTLEFDDRKIVLDYLKG